MCRHQVTEIIQESKDPKFQVVHCLDCDEYMDGYGMYCKWILELV